jgi:hypothetical protein
LLPLLVQYVPGRLDLIKQVFDLKSGLSSYTSVKFYRVGIGW